MMTLLKVLMLSLLILPCGQALAAEKTSGCAKSADSAQAQQQCPKATPAHAWLKQMVGQWSSQSEAYFDPSQPAEKSKGTEVVKALGDFWIVNEVKSTMMGKPFAGNMTMGYDQTKQKYVGTWVDSMTGKLWMYEGNVDATGKVLTLESEGECPMTPGKMIRFKDVTVMQDKNHKTYTSAMMNEKGEWVTIMTSKATRIR
jgi:hypothetical protein